MALVQLVRAEVTPVGSNNWSHCSSGWKNVSLVTARSAYRSSFVRRIQNVVNTSGLCGMENVTRFLDHILPPEGFRCGVAIQGKEKRIQRLFSDNSQLATFLDIWDRRGYDCYHACAVFRTDANRTTRNALGARSFWLDLDVGNDPKKYPTDIAAIEAIGIFCKSFIQPTAVVHSGGGVHIYWSLEDMLDPETWRAQATIFKGLCIECGLKADHVRTADISSILRTPGTHNYKYAS